MQKKVVAAAEVVGVVADIEAAVAAVEEGGVVASAEDAVARKQGEVVAYGAEEPCTPDWQRQGEVVVDDEVEYERDVAHAAAAEVGVGGGVEEEDAEVVDALAPMGLVEEERKAVGREKGMGLKDVVDASRVVGGVAYTGTEDHSRGAWKRVLSVGAFAHGAVEGAQAGRDGRIGWSYWTTSDDMMDSQLEAGMSEDTKHIAEAHRDERRGHHEMMYSCLL